MRTVNAVYTRASQDGRHFSSAPSPSRRWLPTRARIDAERQAVRRRKAFVSAFMSTLGVLVVVAALAVLLATVFLPVLQVSGTSMEPTLRDGDVVVLVKTDHIEPGTIAGFYWQNKLLLKRVIGAPGDVINIDADGVVSVNGRILDEPYVTDLSLGECDIDFPYQVPEGRYFMMGDHRSTSVDSRSSVIGCIEKDQIVGQLVVRVWPFDSISGIE